jgi:hypothetical protein
MTIAPAASPHHGVLLRVVARLKRLGAPLPLPSAICTPLPASWKLRTWCSCTQRPLPAPRLRDPPELV